MAECDDGTGTVANEPLFDSTDEFGNVWRWTRGPDGLRAEFRHTARRGDADDAERTHAVES